MKYLSKAFKSICAVLLLTTQTNVLTGCSDDLAADSYYTFTGEMMSDFLTNHEDFSLFRRIAERAGRMDLLASRGARTLFAPVNSGVEDFLKEKGYASVEDIPAEYCDTLVKTCLVERALYTYDLAETHQENNQLELPLILVTDTSDLDANNMVRTVINRRAAIINELKNDSVENGVVHPVDKVLVPNTSLGSSLLEENYGEFSIFFEALRRTGLLDSLQRFRDESYEQWKNEYIDYHRDMHIGNENYTGKRPDHRNSGFTLFIVPDEVFYGKYGDRFNESMTVDEKIDALYDLATEKYGDDVSASIFGLDKTDPAQGKTYKELYWNKSSLTSRYNPLNMLLSYHILDRLIPSTEKLVNCWGVNTAYLDPTEWIGTMLDFSTIKLERVYNTVDPAVEYGRDYYINHSGASIYNNGERIRGAHLTVPQNADNFALNVAYFYVDDVLAYDVEMRTKVMNTRMRIDFMTLWPELTTNNMRLCGNPTQGYDPAWDNSEDEAEAGGQNYYLPPGYLKNATFSENTIFFTQRPIIYWSSLHGDVLGVLGTSYDVTFRLPDVPPGTYELRLGYCALPDRGIGQVYLDGVPQGIPIDMTYRPDDPRVGGLYNGFNGIRNQKEGGIFSPEVLEENARVMKNNGYYSAPKAAYYNNDGTDMPRFNASVCVTHYNQWDLMRRKICNVVVQPNTHHTVRLRSVLSNATSGNFVLDYMELVPIDICGPGGLGEDIY